MGAMIPDDHAQRRMEQQALRNVRGLLDKLETEDARRGPSARSVLIVLFVVVGSALSMIFIADKLGFFRRADLHEIRSPDTWRPTAPRRAFVAHKAQGPVGKYVEAFVRRIEERAAANPAALNGLKGQARLTVAIRADGSVESVEVNKGSGSAAIDAAARDFARSAGPFPKFAEFGIEGTDVLHITRTFTFGAP